MRKPVAEMHARLLPAAALIALLSGLTPVAAARAQAPAADALPPLCPPSLHVLEPERCAPLGPGGYTQSLVAAGLPFRPAPLDLEPIYPYRGLTPHAYARVITDTPPVYRHPLDALGGLPPLREYEKGFVFVSVIGKVRVGGAEFYQINPGEFMRADDLAEARPSGFQGLHFAAPPGSAVGWLIASVQPSATPGAPPAPEARFAGRYQPIQVLGVQRVGEWDWYLIGPDQWVEQRNLALVPPAPPAGAPPDVIAVNTYEQSLGVYRGGALVFATLVSSGSRAFPTRPGTFKVWAKLRHDRMTGAYFPDRRDYYFLEDVPYVLYYDGDRALHGAYWHDHFGIKSSHGCVNLAPRDSRWLFDNTSVGDTVVVYASERP